MVIRIVILKEAIGRVRDKKSYRYQTNAHLFVLGKAFFCMRNFN